VVENRRVDGLGEERSVRVVPHDPSWPASFEAARGDLAAVVPEALAIEHVGSTSVPGLASKPTVDVLLVVDDLAVVLGRLAELAAIGFEHRPDSFSPERRHLFFRRMVGGERTHHLHVLASSSPEPDDYRLFRDYLRANPDAAARYEAAKLALADRFARYRASYVQAKEPIVEELLVVARAWRNKAGPAGAAAADTGQGNRRSTT